MWLHYTIEERKKERTLGFSDDPNKVHFIVWIYVIWSNAINSSVATSHNWRKNPRIQWWSKQSAFYSLVYVIWSNAINSSVATSHNWRKKKERTLGFSDDPNKVRFIIWIYVIWSNAINSCVATSHNWRKKKAKTLGFSDDPNKVCFIIWIYVIWSNFNFCGFNK